MRFPKLWSGLALAVLLSAAGMGVAQAAAHHVRPQETGEGVSLKGVHTKVNLNLVIETGAMIHKPGWPKFLANGGSSARIVLPPHALVTVTLRSYDNGPSAPPAHFAKVDGTVGDLVKVNGKVYRSFKPAQIAHTFTVVGLDLNAPVPVVSGKAKYLTETFQFVTGGPATWEWQCYAPCGTGKTGWDGAMITPGYMMGTLVVR